MKNDEDELKELKGIVEETWKETYGVTGKEVVEIVDKIDCIFYESDYTVLHNKIAHFVVDCIKKE